MIIMRAVLVLVWIAVLYVTVQAVGSQGLGAAGDIFFADLTSGTWHAQIGMDFAGHLLIMAAWVAWRHKFSILGIIMGVLCIMLGGLFSFAYILVASIIVKGSIKRLLLGAQGENEPQLQNE